MLACGAIERGSAGLDKALDWGLAVRAGFAFAAIDAEPVLEIAEFAIGLAVIAEGGATGVDGFGQDFADDRDEGGSFGAGKVGTRTGRG